MDGLIKGFVNIALDAIAGGENDHNAADDGASSIRRRNHSPPPPPPNEDRSTWAEVVSSGHQGDPENDYSRRKNKRSSGKPSQEEEERGRRNDGDWEVVGVRKQHQHYQQQQHEQYEQYEQQQQPRPSRRLHEEESELRSDGGWEVAGGRKQHHHQQHDQYEEQQQQPSSRKTHKWQASAEIWQGYKRPPNQQEYVDDATQGVGVEPTRQELEDLSKACSRLWELDVNRLVPGKDYEIDCGGGKKVYEMGDMAPEKLFSWLSDDIFRHPTFARFCSLLDNYNPHEGYKEVITTEEKHEQAAFIEEISRTAPIKYLFHYLASKGIISLNYEDFKRMLSRLWFDLYGRGGGSSCSSAFEHVFVGEIKGRGDNDEVSGFHNWIQFYLEEAKGRVDYQGYIFPRRRGENPDSETQLLTIQFEWNGVLKSVSSTLIGASPEFEVALYTLCFFVGGEDNHVNLGPFSVNIKCYRLGNDKIGSAFPMSEY